MKILLLIIAVCCVSSSAAAVMIYFSWDDVSRFLGLFEKEESPTPILAPTYQIAVAPKPNDPPSCVPYTKETQCRTATIGCLSYKEDVKSDGWYMMAETGKCEEKMYSGCSRPNCAPATNFKSLEECLTTCTKQSWPELVGKPKDEAKAVIIAESPIHTTVAFRDRYSGPSNAIFIRSRIMIDYDPDTGLVSKVPRVG